MITLELQEYLHAHIPLSKAMQVEVVSIADDAVTLAAPLAPNINHRDTVFGGSASAVAILAAWALAHTKLRRASIDCRLVIQRNTMDYTHAITGHFTARSYIDVHSDWARFVHMLDRKGRSRITLCAELIQHGKSVGQLAGEFVALRT